MATGPSDGHSEAVDQQRAVGETGQRIVGGLMCEPFLERLALADVAEHRRVVLDLAVPVPVRHELREHGQRTPTGT